MFWENLSQDEQDRYYFLIQSTKPYLAWASLSKTQKSKVAEIKAPPDSDLIEMELLSRKGWGMS